MLVAHGHAQRKRQRPCGPSASESATASGSQPCARPRGTSCSRAATPTHHQHISRLFLLGRQLSSGRYREAAAQSTSSSTAEEVRGGEPSELLVAVARRAAQRQRAAAVRAEQRTAGSRLVNPTASDAQLSELPTKSTNEPSPMLKQNGRGRQLTGCRACWPAASLPYACAAPSASAWLASAPPAASWSSLPPSPAAVSPVLRAWPPSRRC